MEPSDSIRYIESMYHWLPPGLARICRTVTEDPLFRTGYGSAGRHHGYAGGLAVHTAEVLRYSMKMVTEFPDADRNALFVAVVFHDYMKIREYIPEQHGDGEYGDGTKVKFAKTPYRELIRHVAGSHAEFVRLAHELGSKDLPPDTKIKIEHAMLAHHGAYEWGSPVEPQTIEAFILHYADMLSSHYGAGK